MEKPSNVQAHSKLQCKESVLMASASLLKRSIRMNIPVALLHIVHNRRGLAAHANANINMFSKPSTSERVWTKTFATDHSPGGQTAVPQSRHSLYMIAILVAILGV